MIDLGEDVGYVEVKVQGVQQRLDLWQVNNRLAELAREHQGQPPELYHAAVVRLLQELGYPEVSHHTDDRFVGAIIAQVKSLGNAESGEPSGARLQIEAVQPILAVTSGSDFTPVLAGGGIVTVAIYFIATL